MRYRGVIQYEPIESVIRLLDANCQVDAKN